MSVVLTEKVKTELLTCRDVVAMGRYPYTGRLGILTAKDEEIVEEAMETVHALELGNCNFNEISDGQRQRILLARAICQEPEVMILDEPTSFLDVKHKLELLSILERMVREKHITVIMSLHEIELAQKVSDKVMCVKGETITHYGQPEDVFTEPIIRELYEIENGYFDPLFGSMELPKIEGNPKILVISSGGNGIPIYRKLRKEQIPFIAGILYQNDVDYQVAKVLATQVIEETPFEEISNRAYEEAIKTVQMCDTVIDAGVQIGSANRKLLDIIEEAKRLGKM